ncbi:urea transporter [Klebsiella aerogenes]|nr:urea transporter [Klebsiella aerogenes]ELY3087274.1 urea transporter [Klebsiella aerogenes]
MLSVKYYHPLMTGVLKHSKNNILNGMCGYNSILYGIALSIFAPVSFESFILLGIGIFWNFCFNLFNKLN